MATLSVALVVVWPTVFWLGVRELPVGDTVRLWLAGFGRKCVSSSWAIPCVSLSLFGLHVVFLARHGPCDHLMVVKCRPLGLVLF